MHLSETLRKIRESPPPANEVTATMRILVPILRDLGWDSLEQDVLWEYQLRRIEGRVDVALMGSMGPAAFIEAKSPSSHLDDHVEQVLGYAFQEGANICALTTGLEWWLYLSTEKDYGVDERRFAELRLKNDPVEQLATDFAAFLGRESLLDGEAEKKARRVLKARREAERLDKEVPRIWGEMLATPDAELIDLVSKRVYDETNLSPNHHQVTSVLEGTATPSGMPRPTAIRLWGEMHVINSYADIFERVVEGLCVNHNEDIVRRDATARNAEVKTNFDIFSIVNACLLLEDYKHSSFDLEILFDKGFSVPTISRGPSYVRNTKGSKSFVKPVRIKLFGDYYKVNLWNEVIKRVADVLYERRRSDFDRVLNLRMFASRNSNHFRSAYEVGDSGIFVSTDLNAQHIEKGSRKFLEELGYHSTELEILFD